MRRTLPKPAQKPKRPEAPPKVTTETKPETEQPKLTKTELLGLATIPFMLGSALGMGGGEQAPGPMEMPNYLTPVPTPEPPMFYPYIQAV